MNSLELLNDAMNFATAGEVDTLASYLEPISKVDKLAAVIIANSMKPENEKESLAIVVVWRALNASISNDEGLSLPPRKEGMPSLEEAGGPSITVIVGLEDGEVMFGHYLYDLSVWRCECGNYTNDEVKEWWLLPSEGTGITIDTIKGS